MTSPFRAPAGKTGSLTRRTLRPYGIIIGPSYVRDDGRKNNYGIVLKERSRGWRIGYLVVREKSIRRLEMHPDSLETFEPVRGKAVIALSRGRRPGNVELFFLDRPVVVNKGVWHEVAAVSRRAEIKIFENMEVKTEYHDLEEPIRARSRWR